MVKSADLRAKHEYTKEGAFFKKKTNLHITLSHITWEMEEVFKLTVPKFWMRDFPPQKSYKKRNSS